jgi:hypothetical protein
MQPQHFNTKSFYLYAAKNYYSLDSEEFDDDLKRFKYIKRLINRYKQTGDLPERLILNHLTVLFNVFGIEPALIMLEHKVGIQDWSIVKPFLVYMRAITNSQYTGILMDPYIVDKLRKV